MKCFSYEYMCNWGCMGYRKLSAQINEGSYNSSNDNMSMQNQQNLIVVSSLHAWQYYSHERKRTKRKKYRFLPSVCTGYWLHSIECPQVAVVKYIAKLLWKGWKGSVRGRQMYCTCTCASRWLSGEAGCCSIEPHINVLNPTDRASGYKPQKFAKVSGISEKIKHLRKSNTRCCPQSTMNGSVTISHTR